MKIFKELKKLGYIHYSATTIEELDDLPLNSAERVSEQALVLRWFREKYNIDAWVQPFTSEKSNGDLYLPDGTYSYFIFKYGVWVRDKVDFLEPEEAELACLKNLIEIVKQQTHATTN